jgi:hypothetical protein
MGETNTVVRVISLTLGRVLGIGKIRPKNANKGGSLPVSSI